MDPPAPQVKVDVFAVAQSCAADAKDAASCDKKGLQQECALLSRDDCPEFSDNICIVGAMFGEPRQSFPRRVNFPGFDVLVEGAIDMQRIALIEEAVDHRKGNTLRS